MRKGPAILSPAAKSNGASRRLCIGRKSLGLVRKNMLVEVVVEPSTMKPSVMFIAFINFAWILEGILSCERTLADAGRALRYANLPPTMLSFF
ncbi:hypothethical protein (plasmid) [Ralstonia solanacearum CMR15]|nr:hypothethical protein [Ralstonia solanacearum CMR15]